MVAEERGASRDEHWTVSVDAAQLGETLEIRNVITAIKYSSAEKGELLTAFYPSGNMLHLFNLPKGQIFSRTGQLPVQLLQQPPLYRCMLRLPNCGRKLYASTCTASILAPDLFCRLL